MKRLKRRKKGKGWAGMVDNDGGGSPGGYVDDNYYFLLGILRATSSTGGAGWLTTGH